MEGGGGREEEPQKRKDEKGREGERGGVEGAEEGRGHEVTGVTQSEAARARR